MNTVTHFYKTVFLGFVVIFQAHFSFAQKQFIFFSRERQGIHDSAFYKNTAISGAQITYPWKVLEPQKDQYDFSAVEEDLKFLQKNGKRLFVQLQDVTFDSMTFLVPDYIRNDPEYHGGVNSQYDFIDGDEHKPLKAGWVSRRWDPAVALRFHQLIDELGKRFDGRIEGINLPESSVEFSSRVELHPPGFTYQGYVDAIEGNMLQLKKSFHKSVRVQYMNFMPGDPDPSGRPAYLEQVFAYALKAGVGAGGPDIKVYRKAQMDNSYPLIRKYSGKIITAMAVQEGDNYGIPDGRTGKPVTVAEIYDFAKKYLKLDYIFWCTKEPYYSKEVLPMLRNIRD